MTELNGDTIGEIYGPAMKMTDQAEADDYFRQLVAYLLGSNKTKTRAEIEKMARSNLGYFAGYYSNETRERVERLFRCAHPVFGSISQKGAPTMEQAFKAGQKAVATP